MVTNAKLWSVNSSTQLCCGSTCWSYLSLVNSSNQSSQQIPSWLQFAQAYVVANLNIKSFTIDPIPQNTEALIAGLTVSSESWVDYFVWAMTFINTTNWCGEIDLTTLHQMQLATSTLNTFNSGNGGIGSCAGKTSPNDPGCTQLLQNTIFPAEPVAQTPPGSSQQPGTPPIIGPLNRFANGCTGLYPSFTYMMLFFTATTLFSTLFL